MDQLKVFWSGVVKYHFWILTVLILIMSTVAFYMSRSSLDEQVASRFGKLDSDFNNVTRLASEAQRHPNASSDAEMDRILEGVRKDVESAWKEQYDRQISILQWPPNVLDPKQEAYKKLNSFRPIELHLDYPLVKDPLIVTDREVYRDYIKDVFPELAKVIGARWTAKLGDNTAGAYDASLTADSTAPSDPVSGPAPLVNWSQSSQSQLQASIVPWYKPESAPSTLDICYTQEDLWILRGLLQVIRETNGNARENFQAPIKEIEWIRLGKTAGSGAAVFAAAPVDDSGYDSGTTAPMTPTQVVSPDPADNRYVDSKHDPVPATLLREAMKSSSPEHAFFAVAKRVPVRFRVKMDQTKIARLLAECGNGKMMIEVKQVRVNAEGDGMVFGAATYDDSGGDTGDTGVDAGYDASTSGMPVVEAKPDTPVEIYGIVYLFNPVEYKKLGLEKVTSNTVIDGVTPAASGAAPVAPPAPAPAPDVTPAPVPPTPAPTPVPAPAPPANDGSVSWLIPAKLTRETV